MTGRVAGFFPFFLILIASLYAGSFIWKGRIPGIEKPSYGWGGTVHGRTLKRRSAGYFFVNEEGLRWNLDRPFFAREGPLRLTVKVAGRQFSFRLTGPSTLIEIPAPSGPVYAEFELDREDTTLILVERKSRDGRRAMTLILLAGGIALVWIALKTFRMGRVGAGLLFSLIIFILFFSFHFYLSRTLLVPPTGDEPEYLITASSLGRDFDLDVQNQYDLGSFSPFAPGMTDRHAFVFDGRLQSFHYPGLPLLLSWMFLSLPLQIDPMAGASFLFSIFSAFVSLLILRSTDRKESALFAAILCLSYPVIAYGARIYPDILAGLIFLYILSKGENKSLSGIHLFFAAFLTGFLPFLHPRLLPAAAILWVYLFIVSGNKYRLFAGATIATVLILWFNTYYSGHLLTGPYAGAGNLGWQDGPLRLVAQLADSRYGILWFNPLLIFCVPGIALFVRGGFLRAAVFVLALYAAFLPAAFFDNWLLGSCPIGRYWMVALPSLLFFAARGFESLYEKQNRFIFLTVAAILSIPAFCASFSYMLNDEKFYSPISPPGLPWVPSWFQWKYPESPEPGFFLLTGLLGLWTGWILYSQYRSFSRVEAPPGRI